MKAVANMRRAIKTKADVEGAVTRPDIGQIDFIWGEEGSKVDAKGKRKGGFGVAHILEERQRKDGLSPEQAAKVAEEVAKVVATGERLKEHRHAGVRQITVGDSQSMC